MPHVFVVVFVVILSIFVNGNCILPDAHTHTHTKDLKVILFLPFPLPLNQILEKSFDKHFPKTS